MTVMAERTPQVQMSVEEFEHLARLTGKQLEGVRLEFINGRIGVKNGPDGDHVEIITWLTKRCMQHRPDLWMYSAEHGLTIETYRKGRARPDGSLAPEGYFKGQRDWADASGVLMTVEVTSYDSDTHARDREEKPAAYAAAGIPVYLLIDRELGKAVVHSDPDAETGRYTDVHEMRLGATVDLPDPVGFKIDTAELLDYLG
ncbi:Uma2 family endonuclease [Streptomyces sp. NPDC058257]|uniref:Uma2 family endonuclease n=1 Tax=Streptomyces sp. NPDC058257 TaxID=3346409 RepID=UPI0036E2C740